MTYKYIHISIKSIKMWQYSCTAIFFQMLCTNILHLWNAWLFKLRLSHYCCYQFSRNIVKCNIHQHCDTQWWPVYVKLRYATIYQIALYSLRLAIRPPTQMGLPSYGDATCQPRNIVLTMPTFEVPWNFARSFRPFWINKIVWSIKCPKNIDTKRHLNENTVSTIVPTSDSNPFGATVSKGTVIATIKSLIWSKTTLKFGFKFVFSLAHPQTINCTPRYILPITSVHDDDRYFFYEHNLIICVNFYCCVYSWSAIIQYYITSAARSF